MDFSTLELSPVLIQALAAEQITVPTPIQSKALPVLLSGNDAYVSAETGTGKTLAYLLPLFCRIDPALRSLQAIVIVPTHELALQIQQQARRLASNAGLPVRSQVLIGGVSSKRQIDKLKDKPHLVIGSPGRIRELISIKKLKVHTVVCAVIDEADRLLCGDSLASVSRCIATLPGQRQLVFVSATDHPDCTSVAAGMANDLRIINTGGNLINTDISHWYVLCDENQKIELLRTLVQIIKPERAIVFAHRNDRAEQVSTILSSHNCSVADIHSARDKFSRKKALDSFRAGDTHILIASDVMARGLDIIGVSHVFNIDPPSQSKAYLHRAGRTGRAGAPGQAVSIFSKDELHLLKSYQRDLNISISQAHIQNGKIVKDSPLNS